MTDHTPEGDAIGRDPYADAERAASQVANVGETEHFDVALVLGSGWSGAVDGLGTVRARAPLSSIHGFVTPTVAGHSSELFVIDSFGTRVLAFGGRCHLYEGHSPNTVVHAVRTAVLAGCGQVMLTNAAGSLRPEWGPGTMVMLRDQLNLTGASPLTGPEPPDDVPGRFCDLGDLYSERLRTIAGGVATARGVELPEGVYAGMLGGSYETPAEIGMLATLGADLVGMSTVLEAIAAHHLGAEVLGISLVTNLAAGIGSAPLAHKEVLQTADEARAGVASTLAAILEVL